MAELISQTSFGDAPLSAAKHPDLNGSFDMPAREGKGIELVGRTVTVNRPRQELYQFWRQFGNLAKFMQNVRSVHSATAMLAHWEADAPREQSVEWTTVISEDIPNELIAWRSVDGSRVVQEGRVEFRDAPSRRGTEVTATILFQRTGGALGGLLAQLFHHDPKTHTRRQLRRFKQLMETGEISTAAPPDAAPRS
jgi:uncharacterized membrane protein